MDQATVVIRSFHPDTDQACIYATWRNSAYFGFKDRSKDAKDFFKKHTALIREILKGALVRIACLEDDPMTIIGYSISTGTHLDWIYVKVDYRNKGIGTMLMPKSIETVTNHVTKIGESILAKKNFKIKGEKSGTIQDGRREDTEAIKAH